MSPLLESCRLSLQAWARPYTWFVGVLIFASFRFFANIKCQTPQERVKLIQTLRSALDSIGLQETPIVAGVGGNSTRETIQLARDAAAAGANFALVIAPGYWAGYLKGNPAAARKFFVDVAAASPIPVYRCLLPLSRGKLIR